MAMVTVGLGMLVIVLPLSLLIRHKPEHYGYQPDGDVNSTAEITEGQISPAITEVNIPSIKAIKYRAFWHVAIASMFHAFVVTAVVTHMMPYLSSLGIARSLSSLVALALSVASIGGRLSSGWLADRLGSRQVLTASLVLMTMGLFLFEYVTDAMLWLLVPFIITFSFGWGCSVTTRISLIREHFGRGNFGSIIGFLSGIMMFGNMTGAPITGWVFDSWGSYKGAWLSFGTLTVAGAVLAFTIPSSNRPVDRQTN